MKTLLLVGVSCLLLASPAMSATYYIGASATGGPQPDITQDTPLSLSGAGEGATFTGNATDANGGTASAFASEGISNVTDYNNSLYSHYYGIDGGVTSVVKYTIRISGPVTGELVPIHITANASAGSLAIPDDVYAPIIAGAGSSVSVQYAGDDTPVGAPDNGTLVDVYADTQYNYKSQILYPPVCSATPLRSTTKWR